MSIETQKREEHRAWLLGLTGLPTAAGHEGRVIAWIEEWVGQRDGLTITRDEAGNMMIAGAGPKADQAPMVMTAHMDHPAFVVDRVVSPTVVEASFRGGVMEAYFRDARVVLHGADGEGCCGTVVESEMGTPFRKCVIELDEAEGEVGDVLLWELPEPVISDGMLRTRACDDLAALVAALAAMDELRETHPDRDVRILLTVAEEVGFVGAIAACKLGTIPAGARVLALENSRSFEDSPIGGGPIVRVGDRMSTFSPTLTRAVAKAAERLAGGAEQKVGDPTPVQTSGDFKWQRKLMAGGACEATAYCAFGHDATCICLPLGNYHNMGEQDRVQAEFSAGKKEIEAHAEPERIAMCDFDWLVDLLVACGVGLEDGGPVMDRLEKLYAERRFVLEG